MMRDRFGHLIAGEGDRAGNVDRAAVETGRKLVRDAGERVVHITATFGDCLGHGAAGGLQRGVDVVRAGEQR